MNSYRTTPESYHTAFGNPAYFAAPFCELIRDDGSPRIPAQLAAEVFTASHNVLISSDHTRPFAARLAVIT